MKKVFKMEDLECANCAAKMEAAISKLEGVKSCTISFMTQKMTLECEEEQLADILKKAQAAIRKFEPDCRIVVK
jgi:copper chaperone CopZ